MQNVLFDTNTVIYFLKRDPRMVKFFHSWNNVKVSISVISWIEVLVGSFHHDKKIDEIIWSLSHFARLPVNDAVGQAAAFIMQEKLQRKEKKAFQDNLIAATALTYKMPLLTNNPRDFRGIKNLRVISPKR